MWVHPKQIPAAELCSNGLSRSQGALAPLNKCSLPPFRKNGRVQEEVPLPRIPAGSCCAPTEHATLWREVSEIWCTSGCLFSTCCSSAVFTGGVGPLHLHTHFSENILQFPLFKAWLPLSSVHRWRALLLPWSVSLSCRGTQVSFLFYATSRPFLQLQKPSLTDRTSHHPPPVCSHPSNPPEHSSFPEEYRT